MPNRFLTHDAKKANREPNVFVTWAQMWKEVLPELKLKAKLHSLTEKSKKKG